MQEKIVQLSMAKEVKEEKKKLKVELADLKTKIEHQKETLREEQSERADQKKQFSRWITDTITKQIDDEVKDRETVVDPP